MKFRLLFGGSALAAGLFVSAAPQAATLTGDFATWAAAAGSYATTATTGLSQGSLVTTVPLGDGATLSLAGTADTVAQPLAGWGLWSGGYTGDVITSTTNSETITFSGRSALGFELSPDVAFFGGPYPVTFTVTLSDGTTASFTESYPDGVTSSIAGTGVTQFVGFYGGGVDSLTITVTGVTDFAFGNIVDAPEPLSLAVLLTGLAGLGLVRRRAAG